MDTITSTPTMSKRAADRSRPEQVLLWLEILLAVGAYAGAIGFLLDGLDLGDAMAKLPFGSPVFAGLALGLINGVLPTVVAIGAWRRRPWAEMGHFVVGAALVAWIVVQVWVLGPPVVWLQVLYFTWGWAIVGFAWFISRKRLQHTR